MLTNSFIRGVFRRSSRKRALACWAVFCTAGPCLIASDHKARIITFDAPSAGTGKNQGTSAFAINPRGVIAGVYGDATNVLHGFVRTREATIIESHFAACSVGVPAVSVNREGAIIGFCADSSSVFHGLLRTADGEITTFDAPGAGTAAGQGTFTAFASGGINAAGTVTGDYLDANNVFHGFVRTRDGDIVTFDAPGAGTGAGQGTMTSFYHYGSGGINLRGVITGTSLDASNVFHAFVRTRDGTITSFNAPGAGTGAFQGTFSGDINPAGVITGWYCDAVYCHGFLRYPSGTITPFDPPGSVATLAFDINPAGAVTGFYVDASNVYHGYVRAPDGTITAFDPPGSILTQASAINPEGLITGLYIDAKNVFHGFVRIPCERDDTEDAKSCEGEDEGSIGSHAQSSETPSIAHQEPLRGLLQNRLGVRQPFAPWTKGH